MKSLASKIVFAFGLAVGLLFTASHQALANNAQFFEDCHPSDATYRYTCLPQGDCASATAGTPGGPTGENCEPGQMPGEFSGQCCKIIKPSQSTSSCTAASGNCKAVCDPAFESDLTQASCPNGQVCCAPKATTASQACAAQGGSCKLGGCAQGDQEIGALTCVSGYVCCKPSALVTSSSTKTTATGAKTNEPVQANSPDRLVLPACTKTGNCTLDDVVQAGINFATFIMGLSGALFFAVFIYGGALYLASFGSKSRVEKGKAAIKGAVIGMIFVLGAWTIVNTLVQGLRFGKSPSDNVTQQGASTLKPEEKCPAQGPGYSCVTLSGTTGQQAMADGQSKGYSCITGLCPGAANILCCKQ